MKTVLILLVDVRFAHATLIPHLTWKLPWQVEPPCSRKPANYVCDTCSVALNTEGATRPSMQTVVSL